MCTRYDEVSGTEFLGEPDVATIYVSAIGKDGYNEIDETHDMDVNVVLAEVFLELLKEEWLKVTEGGDEFDVKAELSYTCGCVFSGDIGVVGYNPCDRQFYIDAYQKCMTECDEQVHCGRE